MNINPSDPLVSVICLCYNHELFLESSLDSLQNQTYKNLEIIIIDDFSQDNSKELIAQWIDKNNTGIFMQNLVNIGNVKSFNKALKIASGKYVVDFATDDLLLPNYLQNQVNNFEHSHFKNAAVSYCNVENINDENQHLSYNFPVNNEKKAINSPPQGFIYINIIKGYFINSSGMMMSKASLVNLEGYDESLAYEDLDYLVRASRNYPMIYLDEVLVKKRILPLSMTTFFVKKFNQKSIAMNTTTYNICYKIYKLNIKNTEHLALLQRIGKELKTSIKSIQIILIFKYMRLIVKILFRIIKRCF